MSMKKVRALGRCIETLLTFALMDTQGAIKEALESDKRVWKVLNDDTKQLLSDALGLEEPK